MLANHDLAQIHGEGIMKAGTSVCEAFNAGVKRDFSVQATVVTVAITEFLLTFRWRFVPGRLFFCHSLPTDEQIKTFDFTVFDRQRPDRIAAHGPVYQLIWGRNVTPAGVDEFRGKSPAPT